MKTMHAPNLPDTSLPPGKLLKKVHRLQKKGKYKESLALCEKLATQGFQSPDLLHFHGLALRACNDLTGALVKINAAVEQRPNDALMLNSLGVVFLQLKELEVAIEIFKRATKADEKLYDPWKNLGIALKMAERYQAALLAFTCAHHIDSTRLEPQINLMLMLIDLRLYKQAEEVMDKLLADKGNVTPSLLLRRMFVASRLEDFDYIARHRDAVDRSRLNQDEVTELDNIWAYYLRMHGRIEDAVDILEDLVEKETSQQDQCITHLGWCYAQMGRLADGIALHEAMLEKNPEHVSGRYNLAFLQFRNGDVAEGFKNYEARWRWPEFPSKRRLFDLPRWQGESIGGKRLLVWREQGIGDEVRFASVIADLQALECDVTFECSPKLLPLWEHSFPWATIRCEGELDCRGEEAYTEFDYQIPVGSLGSIFRPTVSDFHQKQTPWIRRYAAAENRVRAQLQVKPDQMVIGVCWRSSYQVTSRDLYLMDSKQIAPLGALPNCTWLNVQYDCAQEEVEAVRGLGLDLHHFTDLDQKNDLVGACSLLGACDLVISVGVSVADLAAGMGVPVVQISSKHEEIYLGTDHVPWFPTCKSVRMPPHGGDGAIASIVDQWPAILAWAKDVTPEDAKPHRVESAVSDQSGPDRLDHEFGCATD
ncbi:MAG: tetratricopeptide repeat-containing glycosyltransferase family protein [Alphaproteobacteria bacterium]|nr:tetratricopeptide repeat-containing glycosyltransferase family protein [Alphaproteobacteria bacterium]